jgi:hypothetical protein
VRVCAIEDGPPHGSVKPGRCKVDVHVETNLPDDNPLGPGQYCLGFGGASVDRRLGQEVLKVISPLGVEASLKALEELSAGDAVQRANLSSKLEQLEYEAKKAFEQYDAVDARNRLVAGELERQLHAVHDVPETIVDGWSTSRKVAPFPHHGRPGIGLLVYGKS